ncbi:hypothetical protein [Salegentibacter holothuriorum]|nr:hypothetical protein [Salegentibacter holothuriorum]
MTKLNGDRKSHSGFKKEIEMGWDGPDSSMTMDGLIESRYIAI